MLLNILTLNTTCKGFITNFDALEEFVFVIIKQLIIGILVLCFFLQFEKLVNLKNARKW